MSVLSFPLIARELRVQSRKRSTYSARFGWGLTAVALLAFFVLNFPRESANGRYVLSMFHACVAVMLFFLSPIGAADAISQEKREGTLGLLLLTRLNARQIVLGKLASHLIGLFYVATMMLPFMVIPVLLGGVGWQDFTLCVIILFMIAAVGVSAGLIASALFTSFGAALGCAMIVSLIGTVLVAAIVANGAMAYFFPTNFGGNMPMFYWIFAGPALLLAPLQARDLAGFFTTSRSAFWCVEMGLLLPAILLLGLTLIFGARKVAGFAEFRGETQRKITFRKTFLTPVLWKKGFRRWLSRKLDRNPFIWLEYRAAWARVARWAMTLLIVSIETMLTVTMPSREDFVTVHFMMLFGLLTFLTFKSSSSFQREKESGAFELLLVTPTTERKLWAGRLRAVAAYYAPPVLMLAVLGLFGYAWWVQLGYYYEDNPLPATVNFTSLCASCFSVPVCGLFFALRCRTFLPALLWTGGLAVIGPLCLWFMFNGLVWMAARAQWGLAMLISEGMREVWWPVLFAVVGYHVVVASLSARAAIRLLESREFGPI